MKKTSTKLFLAAATLGLAAASTIGSTYAWFTINGKADVTGFNMTVSGDKGIFIRDHGTGAFSTEYSIDTATIFPNTLKFTAVTPVADSNLGTFNVLDVPATVAATNTDHTYKTKALPTGATATGGVMQLDDVGYYYVLDLDVRVSNGSNIAIYAKEVVDSGASNNKTCKASNVLRVGIIKYATDGTTPTGTTYRLHEKGVNSDYATNNFRTAFNLAESALAANPADTGTVIDGSDDSHKAIVTPVQNTGENTTDEWNTEHIKVVVWYEGSSWECSNEIFDTSVSFTLVFEPIAA